MTQTVHSGFLLAQLVFLACVTLNGNVAMQLYIQRLQ